MTQLNLSGRQSSNKQQNTAAEPEGESIKNQTVGALGALAMFAAVIVIGSCSHSSKPVATQQRGFNRQRRFQPRPSLCQPQRPRRCRRRLSPKSTARPRFPTSIDSTPEY